MAVASVATVAVLVRNGGKAPVSTNCSSAVAGRFATVSTRIASKVEQGKNMRRFSGPSSDFSSDFDGFCSSPAPYWVGSIGERAKRYPYLPSYVNPIGFREVEMARMDFDAVPAVGTVVMVNHQSYELVSTEPYTRRDGTPSTVLVWKSTCPDCGDEFQVRSGLKGSAPARRCEQHRRLARVDRKRRGGNQITVIPA